MHIKHSSGLKIDLGNKATWASPWMAFQQLHNVGGLARARLPMQPEGWLAFTHNDVSRVFKETDLFKNDPASVGKRNPLDSIFLTKVGKSFTKSMIFVDDAPHRHLRSLANKAFTPSCIRQLHEQVVEVTNQLLDEIPLDEPFDLISKFALPLPLRIIARMLGVTPEERDLFHSLMDGSLSTRSSLGMIMRIPASIRLHRLLKKLIERKRANPEDDLISALILAENEGERLTAEELMGSIFLLLLAGHETTVNLIGNGTLAFIEHDGLWSEMQQAPDKVPNAIEEVLRFYSPAATVGMRWVAEDCELGNVPLKRGDHVAPLIAAANRDPLVYADPDEFRIDRTSNKHVAFGGGPHLCIGAHLSRLEGKIAFETLLERFDRIELKAESQAKFWQPYGMLGLRGLTMLPVQVSHH